VLELLQQALARGADPHLDSLTKCTGGRMTARGGTPASGVAQGAAARRGACSGEPLRVPRRPAGPRRLPLGGDIMENWGLLG
jgi:hypothetical protein